MNFYCHRTNGTFAFAPTPLADPSAKAKEPFFPSALFRNKLILVN
ncbi:MAG: hypothetical protein QY303_04650 [Vicingaceae bacterium]|nr:MAG: hypothetical protein QY303_04650 [Vicingaceae bacterium]